MDDIVQVNVLRAGGEHRVPGLVHEPRSPLAVVTAALTLSAAVTLPSKTLGNQQKRGGMLSWLLRERSDKPTRCRCLTPLCPPRPTCSMHRPCTIGVPCSATFVLSQMQDKCGAADGSDRSLLPDVPDVRLPPPPPHPHRPLLTGGGPLSISMPLSATVAELKVKIQSETSVGRANCG